MTPTALRQQIGDAFSRAAPEYHRHATLQHTAARHLVEMMPALHAGRILDIGCGTGAVLNHLAEQHQDISLYGLDLAAGMLNQARRTWSDDSPVRWVQGNAEMLPLAEQGMDYVTSCLALQWCDLSLALAEIERVLKPGGTAFICTLLRGSFHEFNQACHALGHQSPINSFMSLADVERTIAMTQLVSAGVQLRTLSEHSHVFTDALRHLRGIGANTRLQGTCHPLPARRLQAVWQEASGGQRYTISYRVGFLQLTRPSKNRTTP
ncbi:methyltransferase domain-containing protein [Larsenimonas rhizosphaerae]|uniref:Methyltransferase domain-containing protein n=1 Tax=Larsenimonas rhizosphaerae TaxID=2944682 RepID=A0AA42CWY7_9GAMM|nr:methyltransferase domain-containing protein [Larsenimonas rhizosphaerae]MCX2523250.1 methyltransferase domain-containing protein [Larsenimonas rhizosphaerae]